MGAGSVKVNLPQQKKYTLSSPLATLCMIQCKCHLIELVVHVGRDRVI